MNDESAVPEDLDGHSVDELIDYLDRGRTPRDPSIEDSAACRLALGALERLRIATGDLLDPVETPPGTTGWVAAALEQIPLEARPGRRFRIESDDRVESAITEGALRGLSRAVGDGVPGLLSGRVRIEPDETSGTARLVVQVALVHGARLPAAVAELDRSLRAALKRHLPYRVTVIDVEVVDVIDLRRADS